MMAVIRDVTGRKRAEADRAELAHGASCCVCSR
jgi:hypothetical protein